MKTVNAHTYLKNLRAEINSFAERTQDGIDVRKLSKNRVKIISQYTTMIIFIDDLIQATNDKARMSLAQIEFFERRVLGRFNADEKKIFEENAGEEISEFGSRIGMVQNAIRTESQIDDVVIRIATWINTNYRV